MDHARRPRWQDEQRYTSDQSEKKRAASACAIRRSSYVVVHSYRKCVANDCGNDERARNHVPAGYYFRVTHGTAAVPRPSVLSLLQSAGASLPCP